MGASKGEQRCFQQRCEMIWKVDALRRQMKDVAKEKKLQRRKTLLQQQAMMKQREQTSANLTTSEDV